jgi:AraC family transcriptional regulator of adaptative response/methylated-DNA-[protein]-cysteine methyltransferase
MLLAYTIQPCWLGHVLVAAGEAGVRAILLGDEPAGLEADLRARCPGADLRRDPPGFGNTARAVLDLIEQPAGGLDLPLDLSGGTPFQQRVWQALREIPCGQTVSYAGLAARLGLGAASARAVAHACGANALAVAVPCHRVVGKDGRLTGYRWGVWRKERLLARERGI